MSEWIQLELNIEQEHPKFSLIQQQINQMSESMGKVRRKLFSEIGQMKKLFLELKEENERLSYMLKEMKNEKTEWIYGQHGCLFEMQQRAVG